MARPVQRALGARQSRRGFMASALGAVAALGCRGTDRSDTLTTMTRPSSAPPPPRMPVLFVGHGSPMNAIEDNRWSQGFRAMGLALPEPRAVLCVSAHWCLPGTFVTDNAHPETIHDFGGFPPELHQVRYPAPGEPALAARIQRLLAPLGAAARSDWGLDHGTWSVLCHLRPNADVPVLQLSIDARLSPAKHIDVGRALEPLRDEGVLILGSGNIVHNLRDAFSNMRSGRRDTPRWASEFDGAVASALEQRDWAFLSGSLGSDAGRASHPTPEHYLPLLYAFGASGERDAIGYPVTGFDAGSLSMRSVRFG